jgi:hypothetical protein
MADSHAHLKITAEEWEAFLDDFQQTLDKFTVPVEEQAELKAIVKHATGYRCRLRRGSRLSYAGSAAEVHR